MSIKKMKRYFKTFLDTEQSRKYLLRMSLLSVLVAAIVSGIIINENSFQFWVYILAGFFTSMTMGIFIELLTIHIKKTNRETYLESYVNNDLF